MHVEIARTWSNLVADRFAAGLSQILLRYPGRRKVRGWSQTCRRPNSSCQLAASELDNRPNSSSLRVCDQLRTRLRPDSVMEFGLYKPRWFARPQTVTNPSTNRARRRVTLLIETNALPLSQAATGITEDRIHSTLLKVIKQLLHLLISLTKHYSVVLA